MARPSPQTDRVVAVLDLLSDDADRGATTSEIARRLDVNRASCVHMLAALERASYVVRDPRDKRFHLGPGLIAPGTLAARRFPLLGGVQDELRELTRTVGQPCVAFTADGTYARVVHYTWNMQQPAPALEVGDLVPMRPPLGSVFMAWSTGEHVDRWLDAAQDPAPLRAKLDAIRRQGWVVELVPPPALLHQILSPVDDGSPFVPLGHPDDFIASDLDPDQAYPVSSISMPVFGPGGDVDVALNVVGFTGPVRGSEVTRLAEQLQAAAARLAEGASRPMAAPTRAAS